MFYKLTLVLVVKKLVKPVRCWEILQIFKISDPNEEKVPLIIRILEVIFFKLYLMCKCSLFWYLPVMGGSKEASIVETPSATAFTDVNLYITAMPNSCSTSANKNCTKTRSLNKEKSQSFSILLQLFKTLWNLLSSLFMSADLSVS